MQETKHNQSPLEILAWDLEAKQEINSQNCVCTEANRTIIITFQRNRREKTKKEKKKKREGSTVVKEEDLL